MAGHPLLLSREHLFEGRKVKYLLMANPHLATVASLTSRLSSQRLLAVERLLDIASRLMMQKITFSVW